MLIIDSLEPIEMRTLVMRLASSKKIPVDIRRLTTAGDYYWDDIGLCIERKTIEDFANSITEDRITHQMLRMKEYPISYLFISGPMHSVVINGKEWSPKKHGGAKVSLSAKFGIPILQFLDDTLLAEAIFSLYEKYIEFGQNPDIKPVINVVKKSDVIDPNYHLFRAVPGIGKKKADEIMAIYPSFYGFLMDYKSNLSKVKVNKMTKEFIDKL